MSQQQSAQSYEVQLAVYDLSRGMARNLSAQLLGPDFAVDVIPHTGLVVYGREYFFGGGIQCEDPAAFRRSTGLLPYQVLPLGRTAVDQASFERWCARVTANGAFGAAAYDLLQRNCNNFCHAAVTQCFNMPSSVFPAWILDVPRRFLQSPLGSMVRPMLQNMQISSAQGAQPVAAAAPIAEPEHSRSTAPIFPHPNPWSNIAADAGSLDEKKDPTDGAIPLFSEGGIAREGGRSSPLLDAWCSKPLLSSDTKTVDLCIRKLSAQSEQVRIALSRLALVLQCTDESTTTQPQYLVIAERHLMDIVESGAPELRIFALMLLRLTVLRCRIPRGEASNEATVSRGGCVDRLWKLLNDGSSEGLLNRPALRSMAWLIVSNAMGAGNPGRKQMDVEPWIDLALADMGNLSSGDEVRQAASALLYNAALSMASAQVGDSDNEGALSDTTVSLLCSATEDVANERDVTVKLRRLMIAGRIVVPMKCPVHQAAKSLLNDLGFAAALRTVSDAAAETTSDGKKCQRLASELLQILRED